MNRRWRRWSLGLCAPVALGLSACQQTLDMPRALQRSPEPPPAQMELRREYWDKALPPKHLRRETEGLVQIGGAFQKNGRERSYFRGGAVEFERHWSRGEPAGLWETWWENGTLRSRCEFTADGLETEMHFWHENGQLEARGLGRNGKRVGQWEFFRPDGSRESAGELVGGLREGPWFFFDEGGAVRESGSYAKGVKVGPWNGR